MFLDRATPSVSPDDRAQNRDLGWADAAKDKQDARPPPRKRRRIVISCTECHRRKQKCDRGFPCANCVTRSKESACRYETGAPTAKKHGRLATAAGTASTSPDGAPNTTAKDHGHGGDAARSAATSTTASSIPTRVTTFGYAHTGANTLGFLHRLETHSQPPDDDDDNDNDYSTYPDDDTTTPPTSTTSPSTTRRSTTTTTSSRSQSLTSPLTTTPTTTDAGTPAIRDRYKSLIRQLPPRRAIERLAALYFADFNWQYDVLDRAVFDAQLAEWYALPYGVLAGSGPGVGGGGGGPSALGVELRAFPAVVFQICAVALLVVGDEEEGRQGESGGGNGGDQGFEGLKYAGGMTFEDLAREYSEAGVEVLGVLGKRGMGLNTVLAGWVRAGFLKYVGLVTESWHAVGSAIRDAQEIGLHRNSLDPKPASDDVEAVLENQWVIQRRRKTWMTLTTWDTHMACVLGRPTIIDLRMAPPSLPVDAAVPRQCSRTPVLPRGEDDPPTPLARSIWGYHLMRPMREILELEKEGSCPKDFCRIDRLHNELLDLDARTPACFRLENPDTRFDALPECTWLPQARALLPQLTTFQLMALHRPYIFTRPRSRTEALKASLGMLHAQRLHFMMLPPQLYKTFSLFFGTFDAIVLMASIYILFPKEQPDLVQNALQHFHWAVERFEAMSARNPLAKAALGVLHAICMRLRRALGISGQAVRAMLAPPPSSTSSANANATAPALPAWAPTPSSGSSVGPSPSATSSLPGFSTASTLSSGGGSAGEAFSPPQSHHQRDRNGVLSPNLTVDPFHVNLDPDLFRTGGTPALPAALGDGSAPPGGIVNGNAGGGGGGGGGGNGADDSVAAGGGGFDWTLPSDFDWSSLQPIHATSDLIYHDLVGTGAGVGAVGWVYAGQGQQGNGDGGEADGFGVDMVGGEGGREGMGLDMGAGPGAVDGGASLAAPAYGQFGGQFGDDSVWSLLNHYAPF